MTTKTLRQLLRISFAYAGALAPFALLLVSQSAIGQSINDVQIPNAQVALHCVSPEGNFVGGVAQYTDGSFKLVRIAKSGAISAVPLPNGILITATGMSRDGGRMVGHYAVIGQTQTYRGFSWAPSPDGEGTLTTLSPPVPPSGPPVFTSVEARGVSADGTVIACRLISASGSKAAIFPGPTGNYAIFEEGTASSCDVNGISAVGSLVLGDRLATSSSTALPTGFDFDNPNSPVSYTFGTQRGELTCAANNGSVAGFRRLPGNSTIAMRWAIQNSVLVSTELGVLGTGASSEAVAISIDGKRVVGGSSGTAFIWDEGKGIRPLGVALTNEFGVNLTGWPTLSFVSGMSQDGTQLVGKAGNRAYWVDLRKAFSPTIDDAVKISFPSVLGQSYQPQSSPDNQTWSNFGPSIPGTGSTTSFYSERNAQRMFFRIQENQ